MTKMEITSEIVKNVALNNVIEPASKREYKKRNLGDLNLIDNFLFGMLMSDERFQNEAAEIILEILFFSARSPSTSCLISLFLKSKAITSSTNGNLLS